MEGGARLCCGPSQLRSPLLRPLPAAPPGRASACPEPRPPPALLLGLPVSHGSLLPLVAAVCIGWVSLNANEDAMDAIDGDLATKWLDGAIVSTGTSILEVTLEAEAGAAVGA